MAGLNTELWIQGIKENPYPATSFVNASTDLSIYVNNDVLHLAEAGVDPDVHEDYFEGNENPLPLQSIEDIPHTVSLKTYSTSQTRHRQLQDVELQYDKRTSIVRRHRKSIDQNLGARAAFGWTTDQNNDFNKTMILGATDSVDDALIDMYAFFSGLDKTVGLNVCLSPEHLARIKKEDKKLYKEIINERMMHGFKVHQYSQTPLFTDAGVKKPFGSTKDATDKRSSFIWCSDEVFRAKGSLEMYANLRDSGVQADTISFAQRSLVGTIRANNPKYFGTIV